MLLTVHGIGFADKILITFCREEVKADIVIRECQDEIFTGRSFQCIRLDVYEVVRKVFQVVLCVNNGQVLIAEHQGSHLKIGARLICSHCQIHIQFRVGEAFRIQFCVIEKDLGRCTYCCPSVQLAELFEACFIFFLLFPDETDICRMVIDQIKIVIFSEYFHAVHGTAAKFPYPAFRKPGDAEQPAGSAVFSFSQSLGRLQGSCFINTDQHIAVIRFNRYQVGEFCRDLESDPVCLDLRVLCCKCSCSHCHRECCGCRSRHKYFFHHICFLLFFLIFFLISSISEVLFALEHLQSNMVSVTEMSHG